MAAIQGIDFSPYMDDARSSRESSPELCSVSPFEGPQFEGALNAFLPEQNAMSVQRRRAGSSEMLPPRNAHGRGARCDAA